jgi:hypothetical protein
VPGRTTRTCPKEQGLRPTSTAYGGRTMPAEVRHGGVGQGSRHRRWRRAVASDHRSCGGEHPGSGVREADSRVGCAIRSSTRWFAKTWSSPRPSSGSRWPDLKPAAGQPRSPRNRVRRRGIGLAATDGARTAGPGVSQATNIRLNEMLKGAREPAWNRGCRLAALVRPYTNSGEISSVGSPDSRGLQPSLGARRT